MEKNCSPRLGEGLKDIRGRLTPDAPMDRVTWFRAGGLAELMFQPHDIDDLVTFLKLLPEKVPLTVVGVGSNLLVRDGGIPGVVLRLSAKGFGDRRACRREPHPRGRHLPGQEHRRDGARQRHRRFRFLLRHSRLDRRRAPR